MLMRLLIYHPQHEPLVVLRAGEYEENVGGLMEQTKNSGQFRHEQVDHEKLMHGIPNDLRRGNKSH